MRLLHVIFFGDYNIMLIMKCFDMKRMDMNCSERMSFIVDTICAVASVAAVIVALWQTKYSNRKY